MRPPAHRPFAAAILLWLALPLAPPLAPPLALGAAPARPAQADLDHVVIDLADRLGDMTVHREPDGQMTIAVETDHGLRRLSPEQFAQVIHREKQQQREAGFLFVLFNITTWWGVLWVSVGLLGQVFFTFRMVLQWLVSEKQHRSVVPVGFWWGSLLGGMMLLAYFIWRKDIVGILGQSTGAIIYARNLWLIYTRPAADPSKDRVAIQSN